MFRARHASSAPRQGVILLVVVSLLTLFAIVGLSFVLYADAAAKAAQLNRDSGSHFRPEVNSEMLFNYFLGQLIYDVPDDESGIYSALRGHSLLRNMYGMNLEWVQVPDPMNPQQPKWYWWNRNNRTPFNGTGRLRSDPPRPFPYGPVPDVTRIFAADTYDLVNYTVFRDLTITDNRNPYKLKDRFIRDPERMGVQGLNLALYYRDKLDLQVPGTATPTRLPFTGGFNAPYTYPDANNMFLAAMTADGRLLVPSFYRPYTSPPSPSSGSQNPVGFGPTWTQDAASGNLVPNPLWFMDDPVVPGLQSPPLPPARKYMTLRPRPIDQLLPGERWPPNRPYFPAPEDLGGDVKNLVGVQLHDAEARPLENDSIWIDLGFPVLRTPDGRKYKPLFAALILDLDNRINLNVHGNVRGTELVPPGNPNGVRIPRHVSNQGWGPWEVNPGRLDNVDYNDPAKMRQWASLLTGNQLYSSTSPLLWDGRYGNDRTPGLAAPAVPPLLFKPHFYGRFDFDAAQYQNPGRGAPPYYIQTQTPFPTTGTGLSLFPSFPSVSSPFGSASAGGQGSELWQHPSLYNVLQRGIGGDRRFALSDLEAILRYGDTGSPSLTSNPVRLGQLAFAPDPRNPPDPNLDRVRRMVTTRSMDLDLPGVSSWIWDPGYADSPFPWLYKATAPVANNPYPAPQGTAIPFQQLSNRQPQQRPPRGSDYTQDWRAVLAALGRINLNRFLPPYPHQGRGTDQASYSSEPLVDIRIDTPSNHQFRFDSDKSVDTRPDGPIWTQYKAAVSARQQMANDIYRLLLKVTGVPQVRTPQAPTPPDLIPRRWLAQLAVNIVDFIDEDDISTPFNFYTPADGLPVNAIFATNPPPPGAPPGELYMYWVFGTELPRVILNEVQVEDNRPSMAGDFDINVRVELYNPLPPSVTDSSTQSIHQRPVRLFVNRIPTALDPPALAAPEYGNDRGYSTYQVVVAETATGIPGWALLQRPLDQDNVLGTPTKIRRLQTGQPVRARFLPDATNPTIPLLSPGGLIPGTGFLLVGPPGNFQGAPPQTPVVISPDLKYQVHQEEPIAEQQPWTLRDGSNDRVDVDRDPGITVLLRRLACPHLRPYPVAPTDQPDPFRFNPYVTVDYVDRVPSLQSPAGGQPVPSVGKGHPYASGSERVPQDPPTFGQRNRIPGPPTPLDWLVHLDRQLINPMELLHVSGLPPHELTHGFKRTGWALQHRAPWFDEGLAASNPPASHRLYRLFEFLTTESRAAGVALGGRIPGKINLNTFWEQEILAALCDPQQANHFSLQDVIPQQGDSVLTHLYGHRSPSGSPRSPAVGPGDQPLQSLAVGLYAGANNSIHQPQRDNPPIPGSGASATALSHGPLGQMQTNQPEFFHSPPPPSLQSYKDYEMLTKVFSHLTTRSNVFAVWLTVGFFEVIDESTRPVKLGAEIGRAENRHIRHRMFAIIDRTNSSLASCVTELNLPAGTPDVRLPRTANPPLLQLQLSANNGVAIPSGNTPLPVIPKARWEIRKGSTILLGQGQGPGRGPGAYWEIQHREGMLTRTTYEPLDAPISAIVADITNNTTITVYFPDFLSLPPDPPNTVRTLVVPNGTPISLADTPGVAPIFLKPVSVVRSTTGPRQITVRVFVDPQRSSANALEGDYDGVTWRIAPSPNATEGATKFLIDRGLNQETVTVDSIAYPFVDPATGAPDLATGTFTFRITKPHGEEFVITNTLLGNPGPQPLANPLSPVQLPSGAMENPNSAKRRFNPRDPAFSAVVPYYSIIE